MKIQTNNLGKERYQLEKATLSQCVDVYVNKLFTSFTTKITFYFYHNNVLDLQLTIFMIKRT